MKPILIYSSNPEKLVEILKENERLGIVVAVPKVRKQKSYETK